MRGPISTTSSTTATEVFSTCRSATRRGSPRRASSLRWGSVGDSYDNALAETIIGLYKTEVIHPNGPWRSLEEVEFATLEWVDWFNNRRLLSSIGDIPPTEFEALYYEERESPITEVGLN